MITLDTKEITTADYWLNFIRNKGGEVIIRREYEKQHPITQENESQHRNQSQTIINTLLNHGLIEGTPRTGMDQGYILSSLGNAVLNAGGLVKYYEKEEVQRKYTEQLEKSNLFNNKVFIPLQLLFSAIIVGATLGQCYIYHEQLITAQKQLQLQEQSYKQKIPPSSQSGLNKINSTAKRQENRQIRDSSLTQ